MVENRSQLKSSYDEQGYFVIKNYFNPSELTALRNVILKFHQLW